MLVFAKVSFRFILYFLVTKFILTLKYWNRFAALEQIGDGYQGWAFHQTEKSQNSGAVIAEVCKADVGSANYG